MSVTIQLLTGLTPKYRLRDKQAVDKYLEKIEAGFGREINVIGNEFVLTSQLYVDVTVGDEPRPINYLNSHSAIYVNNGTGKLQDNFFAFVERVEPSEFTTEATSTSFKTYFRIYFKVAWWETQLLWGKDLKGGIEGTTVKAHVNDVKKLDNGKCYPYFNITNYNFELNPNYFNVKGKFLRELDNYPDITFLYILSTNSPVSNADGDKNTAGGHKLHNGDYEYCSSLFLYVVPLRNGVIAPCKYEDENGTRELPYSWQRGIGQSFDCINDRNVVSMVVSPFCDLFIGVEHTELYDYVILKQNKSLTTEGVISRQHPISRFSFYGSLDGTPLTALQLLNGNAKNISFDYIKSLNDNIYSMNEEIAIPTTYSEYKENCITKFHTYPYNYVLLKKDDERIIFDNYYCDSISISIGSTLENYYIVQDSTKLLEQKNISILNELNVFTIMQTSDYLTRLNAKQSSILAVSKIGIDIASVVGSAIAQNYAFAVSSGVKAVGDTANAYLTFKKNENMLQNGENGTNVNPVAGSNLLTGGFILESYTIPDGQKEVILDELSRYGYYTNLHPHDILTNHKRKYFNYIQTQNATLLYPQLNEEVRNDITNMFNNGVFLFSEYSFTTTIDKYFSLEVPNYCEIMDGGN